MVKDGCLYLSSEKVNARSDDTFVRICNGSYAQICKFIVDREMNQDYVLVKILKTKTAFPRNHKILQLVEEIGSEVVSVSVNDIDKISVSIDIPHKNWYICAVPNLLSY